MDEANPSLALHTKEANDWTSINIFAQLRNGWAKSRLFPVFTAFPCINPFTLTSKPHIFFAKTGRMERTAMRKIERLRIHKVTGDGRCMFRALVKGMALNKGIRLSPQEERTDADDLRMAVKEVLCNDDQERRQHEHALLAVTLEDSLERYCQRIGRFDFWGGEPELLVLSKLCSQPIIVYIPAKEYDGGASGFIPIQEYGSEFTKKTADKKMRETVKLLYSGRNHYDLLHE